MKIRTKDCACEAPQHVAVLGDEVVSLASPRVQPGPIAVLPTSSPVFVHAAVAAGGSVGPLDDSTRGLIWLSYTRTVELGEVLKSHPNISWVQLPFAGVDAYADVIATHSSDTRVFTSAKGAYAQPVAEHALALILAVLRFIPFRARAMSWDANPLGISLYGKNVTIIGAGGIARELIDLLQPFRCHITIVRRTAAAVPKAFRTVQTQHLSEVLPGSDVVVVAAALTSDTRSLLGAAELALLKSTAALVNVARGALVDTDALTAALVSGMILGAAVDVTEPEPLPDGHPLWSAPNVLITPHMADTPDMTAPLLAQRIRDNVGAFLMGTSFVGVVDRNSGY